MEFSRAFRKRRSRKFVPAEGPKIEVMAWVWSWGQTASGGVFCRIAKADSGLSSPHRWRFPTTNSNPFTDSAPERKNVRLRMLESIRTGTNLGFKTASSLNSLCDPVWPPSLVYRERHRKRDAWQSWWCRAKATSERPLCR
jgi:hypothetical protein